MTEEIKIGGQYYDGRPEKFGPGLWFAIHLMSSLADSMPDESGMRKSFVDFVLDGVSKHTPCLDCRKHFTKYVIETDPVLRLLSPSKDSCLEWSWKLHNVVNARLKKTFVPSLEDVELFMKDLKNGKGCGNCHIGSQKDETNQYELHSRLSRQFVE